MEERRGGLCKRSSAQFACIGTMRSAPRNRRDFAIAARVFILIAISAEVCSFPIDSVSCFPDRGIDSCGRPGASRSRKLLFFSISFGSGEQSQKGVDNGEVDTGLEGEDIQNGQNVFGVSESRNRIQNFIDGNVEDKNDGGRTRTETFVFDSIGPVLEICPAPEEAHRSCNNYVNVRNTMLRHCANGASTQCCTVLETKKVSADWRSFKACSCSTKTACAVEPFVDLNRVFEACGVPLVNLPGCR